MPRADDGINPSERAEETLGTFMARVPEMVIVHREGKICYVNPQALATFGYENASELVGAEWTSFLHPSERGAAKRGAPDGAGATTPTERRFLRRAGSEFVADAMSFSIVFDGEPSVCVIARDTTERRSLQSQLLLHDRMASIGTLAAGVAHEINNPLAYVIANIGFANEELSTIEEAFTRLGEFPSLPPDVGGPIESARSSLRNVLEALREARQGADRVRHIVRDLKTFARGDEDARGPVDVRRVLESSINMAWNEIRHRARLLKDFNAVPSVDANESRLGQVFLNLLINAAQSMPDENADANVIRLTVGKDAEGRAVVEVADTGSGIASSELPRIFDPFYTTKPVGVGTGLGLAICNNIITSFGGEITVESEVGKGSRFRVVLPPTARETMTSSAPPGPAPGVAPSHRGRVLVVDDEPLMGRAVRRLLDPEFEVFATTSGEEALGKISGGERYDVILCDLMMPTVTGMDLHETLRKTVPDQAERMVFMTGGAFIPRAQAFLDRVTNPRLEKPLDRSGLRAAIRSRLR